MSTADKVAEHAGTAAVGVFALMWGDATGGAALLAESFLGFARTARAIKKDSARNACRNATRAVLAAINASPELRDADLERAVSLLTDAPMDGITQPVLLDAVRTATGNDIAPQLAAFLMSRMDLRGDDAATIRVVSLALEAAARSCAAETSFQTDMQTLMLMTLVRDAPLQGEQLRGIEDELAEMRKTLVRQTVADRPDVADEREALIIEMAERYLPTPTTNFMDAYRGIKAALEEYDRMQSAQALPANTGGQIDALLARLDALNNAGQIDLGAQELTSAAAEANARLEHETADLIRIHDLMVSQARLGNRPQDAATALREKLRLEAPPNLFSALGNVQRGWMTRGITEGLNFDLKVAIHLATGLLEIAQNHDQRGEAFHLLGISRGKLGGREASVERLDASITSLRSARNEWKEAGAEKKFSQASNSLGTSLILRSDLAPNRKLYKEAIDAFEGAQKFFAKALSADDWAFAQFQKGTAMRALAQIDDDAGMNELAVTAISGALDILAQKNDRTIWAMAQMNLSHAEMNAGNYLAISGKNGLAVDRYNKARIAIEHALSVFTPDQLPIDRAMALHNLGSVHLAFGQIGPTDEAVSQFGHAIYYLNAALELRRRETEPGNWALTFAARGSAKCLLAERLSDATLAEVGLAEISEAASVVRDTDHLHYGKCVAEALGVAQGAMSRLRRK